MKIQCTENESDFCDHLLCAEHKWFASLRVLSSRAKIVEKKTYGDKTIAYIFDYRFIIPQISFSIARVLINHQFPLIQEGQFLCYSQRLSSSIIIIFYRLHSKFIIMDTPCLLSFQSQKISQIFRIFSGENYELSLSSLDFIFIGVIEIIEER